MSWVIVGLGNPGEKYIDTRHNTGRMAVEFFADMTGMNGFHPEKSKVATVGSGMLGKNAVALVLPDTFMNDSGAAVRKYVKSVKAAERMIVVYDDLDLPLGSLKLSYDRSSGGHRGVESILKAVKTRKFTRVRIGVSPSTPGGKLKKPSGEKEVLDFILGKYRHAELEELKKVFKKSAEAMRAVILEGRERAMNEFN